MNLGSFLVFVQIVRYWHCSFDKPHIVGYTSDRLSLVDVNGATGKVCHAFLQVRGKPRRQAPGLFPSGNPHPDVGKAFGGTADVVLPFSPSALMGMESKTSEIANCVGASLMLRAVYSLPLE